MYYLLYSATKGRVILFSLGEVKALSVFEYTINEFCSNDSLYVVLKVLGVFLLMSLCDSYPQDGGYSFHKFSGPVSGDIQKVDVPGVNPHGNFQTVDYVVSICASLIFNFVQKDSWTKFIYFQA